MSAALRSIAATTIPPRRGLCPGLSHPLPTGDGLLIRMLPAGTITLDAFAALCAAARAHGSGIIEVTARGSIQVRGLTTHSASRFADVIVARGIAGEDGVPILCNPLAGLDPAEIFDGPGFAATLGRAVTQQSLAVWLDPKVSVVVDSGARLNVARLAADIRVRAETLGSEIMLRLGVGGDAANATDLGVIAAEDGVEAVTRLLLVLVERGGRARDVIAADGTACFADALSFTRGFVAKSDPKASARDQCSEAIGLHPLRGDEFAAGIELAFGHAEAAALEKLLDAAAAAGARGLRTAPSRSLLAIGLTRQGAERFFATAAQAGFVTRIDDPRRYVIACAGAPLCASAHIAARAMASELAPAVTPYLRDGLHLHISGCGKGCAHPGVAALTVVGTPEGCALVANGSARGAAFAVLPVHELPAAIRAHLREHRPVAEGTNHV